MRKPLGTEAADTSQALYMREQNRSFNQLGQYAQWGIRGKEAVGWRLREIYSVVTLGLLSKQLLLYLCLNPYSTTK